MCKMFDYYIFLGNHCQNIDFLDEATQRAFTVDSSEFHQIINSLATSLCILNSTTRMLFNGAAEN